VLFEDIINKYSNKKEIGILTLIEEVYEQFKKMPMLVELADSDSQLPASGDGADKELILRFPRIRLSEKAWGKEGTEDREIIQDLLRKIIDKGSNLREKVELISQFLESPPETTDISEIMSHLVLLDTLTSIMEHFNASAAGFTFEGFLAALLEGEQVATHVGGIQDLIDNDKNPISLKLLSDEGAAAVKGSFKDLVNHFVDPGGLKRDPSSNQYVGQSGAEGAMTYVIALKSFREKEAAQKLKGKESITFYQFDFTAQTFLDALFSDKHNVNLLLLPAELHLLPSDKDNQDSAYDPVPAVLLKNLFAGRTSGADPGTAYAYKKILQMYDSDYAKELLDGAQVIPSDKNPNKGVLANPSGEPIKYTVLPTGDVRIKKVGKSTHKGYRTYRESVRMLQAALQESPEKFWGLIARTSGYEGGAGETQFIINKRYYKPKRWVDDGFGYVGQISVGRQAITELAQKYVEVLNQKIFDIFEVLEILTGQINKYFVAGEKKEGLAAAQTALDLSDKTRTYAEEDSDI